MNDKTENGIETLISRAAEPGIDDLSRANRARVALDTLEDMGALAGLVPQVFPGVGIATVRAERVSKVGRKDPEAQRVIDAHRGAFELATPSVQRAIASYTGNNAPITPLAPSYAATPLILAAAPMAVGQSSFIVPDLVTTAEGRVNADDYTIGGEFTIDDVGQSPDIAAISVPIAEQVVDWVDANGAAFIDQVIEQMVNRAAERHIVQALIASVGPDTIDAGNDLAGILDTTEGRVAEAVIAECEQIVVNPVDWPRIRRIVAQSWEMDPHPQPMVSIGVPKGTIIMVGHGATYIEASPFDNSAGKLTNSGRNEFGDSIAPSFAIDPEHLGRWLTVSRYFRTIIREPAGIAAISIA